MATTTFSTTINTTYSASPDAVKAVSPLTRFLTWSKEQQHNRFLWLGIALGAHGCVLTPLTVMAVLLAGNSLVLFMLAIIAMGMTLVTNLAAMPTKITIPVFILSVVIDITLMIAAVAIGLNPASVNI